MRLSGKLTTISGLRENHYCGSETG